MLPEPDRIRLQHMLDAAAKAVRLSAGHDRAELEDEDSPLADALVHLISVIGEAAGRVSSGTQSALGGIRWPEMVSMRNRLVHAYFDINLDILWATVQDYLPPLIQYLKSILEADQEG